MKKRISRNQLLIIILLVFFSLSYLVYLSMPSYMLNIDSRTDTGKITSLEKSKQNYYLTYSYFNSFNNTTYELGREVLIREFKILNNKKNIQVTYPRYFPNDAVIEEIDFRKPILLIMLLHLAGIIALIRLISLFKPQ